MIQSMNVNVNNTDSKSKNQPRKLYKTLPDRSGARYLIDETRGKSRASRSVLFEEINLELYTEEARLVGFITNAERLSVWVARFQDRYIDVNSKCPCFRVTWQEADSSVDAAKCDKILLQIFRITPSGNEIQLTTITIFVTNGRIQV